MALLFAFSAHLAAAPDNFLDLEAAAVRQRQHGTRAACALRIATTIAATTAGRRVKRWRVAAAALLLQLLRRDAFGWCGGGGSPACLNS
jgi:hypothetical protein